MRFKGNISLGKKTNRGIIHIIYVLYLKKKG